MTITIRQEAEQDYKTVETITRNAFWNLYVPGANEHYLVHTMRNHKDYIPELSFVIEMDGNIVGSIHFTKAWIVTPENKDIQILHLGPVAIAPELHRQGLGKKLITHAIEQAMIRGDKAIVLGGFRYHYEPYGFMPSKKYNITMTDGLFYEGIMLLPLQDGALDEISGTLKLSECLYPKQEKLEIFDRMFPPLVKKVEPCQQTFFEAATKQDFNTYED